MPFVERGDARVFYETMGDGPPLLLVAGIASDVASWAPVVPLLERDFRLIMFDNRGAGRTEHAGTISPDSWCEDAIAVLNHLNVDKAAWLGHSLGGMIALAAASKAPARVSKLVISAATASRDPKSQSLMEEMAALHESGMEPSAWFRLLFHWLFAPQFFADPKAVADAGLLAAAYEHCQSPKDFRRQVDALDRMTAVDTADIQAPSLLMLGSDDLLIPPAASRQSFAGMRRLSEVVIENAGHSVHWDQPDAFSSAVMDFLKG